MAAPPVTFPCPLCSRRMGVPAELLGRQVRCPHCKQVVVAPATAGAAPAPAAAPPPEPELRPFDLSPHKESADSILSEPTESDDEVFGSSGGSKLRTLPPLDPPPVEPPAPHVNPFGIAPSVAQPFLTGNVIPLPAPEPAPAPALTAEQPPADPFADLSAPSPVLTPANPPANPFANFDAPIPVKLPAPVEEMPAEVEAAPGAKATPDVEPVAAQPPVSRGRADASTGGGGKTVLLAGLAGYALLATAVAVYGLFFRTAPAPDAGHPLSAIPDTFGEFDPVSRKKVGRLTVPADAELPPAQRARLGGEVAIGQLKVKPVRVEKRALLIHAEDAAGKEQRDTPTRNKALVLTLDITNTSPDLAIHPMDPAFTRRDEKSDHPVTRLVAGPRAFYGGEIEWPLPARLRKKLEVQQGNDAIPLKPGESREYVVFTAADADVVKVAEAEKGPLQWRVQLRRGLIDYKGREVPVTAVVGVDFAAADIRVPQ